MLATILSQAEALYQEQEEFASVATTFKKRQGQKFPARPIPSGSFSVNSLRQPPTKDIDRGAKSYYLSPHLTGCITVFLRPQPYELRTIDEQSEELRC